MTIQEEINEQYKNVIAQIDSDLAEGKTYSFHHYAVKYSLSDTQRLQTEWAKHHHGKKGGNVHKNYKTEMGKKIALRRAVKIIATMFASDKLDKLFALDNESYVMPSAVTDNISSAVGSTADLNDLK